MCVDGRQYGRVQKKNWVLLYTADIPIMCFKQKTIGKLYAKNMHLHFNVRVYYLFNIEI